MSKFRSVVVALAVVAGFPVAVSATSQEDAYISARDKYLKHFDKADINDATQKAMDRALDDLKDKVAAVIGPVAIKGGDAKPHNNLDTLSSGDDTFGHLDGLAFGPVGNERMTLVSTDGLLKSWLAHHKTWWGRGEAQMPQTSAGALKTERFYTQAIGFDAAFQFYAELPIIKPASASFAVSYLYVTAQDIGPWKPTQILVSAVDGGRVYVVTSPAKTVVPQIAACDAIWKAAENKTAGAKNFDDIRNTGDADFHRCFAKRVKTMPEFPKLTAEAQALVETLSLK